MAADQVSLGRGADGAAAAAPSTLPLETYDHEQVYCRRLGHHLQFSYCRRAETGNPCSRVGECWYDRAAVLDFLRARLSGWESRPPPPGKLESILAIVARIRDREKNGSPPD